MTNLFHQECAYLDSLQHFGIKLGLEQSRELADRCGAPDRKLRFLHLAGTNGKGSVGAMLERALRENHCITGFYSSPHLISVRERIRVNGQAVSEEEFGATAAIVRNAAEAMRQAGRCPTYFEFLTVMALLIFAHHRCDWVVWETGMGGRLDSTNIVMPEIAVITGIALDHQKYLGHTIPEIAREKAGIVKPGRTVVAGAMPTAARSVIAERAHQLSSPLWFAEEEYPERPEIASSQMPGHQRFRLGDRQIELMLPGPMQRRNAQVALTVLRQIGLLNDAAVRGLALTRWPGRIELCADNRVLVDGGHNPDGLLALCEALRSLYPGRKLHWVFGAFADKDFDGGLKLIAPLAATLEAVGFAEGSRLSAEPEAICRCAREAGIADCRSGRNLSAILQDWLERTPEPGEPPLVVAGSLYLAGEALAELEEESRILDL